MKRFLRAITCVLNDRSTSSTYLIKLLLLSLLGQWPTITESLFMDHAMMLEILKRVYTAWKDRYRSTSLSL